MTFEKFSTFFFQLIRREKKLIYIFLIALILRFIFFYFYPDQNFPDAIAYRTMGEELLSFQHATNHIYMPLYPIFTFITSTIEIQRILEIFISASSTFVIAKIAKEVFNSENVGYLGALIFAVYPFSIFYSTSGLTETLYTFILLLSFYLLFIKQFSLGSFFLVLMVLIRPTLDFLNPILLLIFSLFVHKLSLKDSVKNLLVYFVFYIAMLSPWWAHQYSKYGEFIRLNLADGIVLYSGNNYLNHSGGGIVGADVDMRRFNDIENPVLKNRAMIDEALSFIVNNPSNFIVMGFKKFFRFWRLWPYAKEYSGVSHVLISMLSFGLILFTSILYLIEFGKKHFRLLSPFLITIIYLSLIHSITIGSIRYRFPIEPFLILFSSFFLTHSDKIIRIVDLNYFFNKKW